MSPKESTTFSTRTWWCSWRSCCSRGSSARCGTATSRPPSFSSRHRSVRVCWRTRCRWRWSRRAWWECCAWYHCQPCFARVSHSCLLSLSITERRTRARWNAIRSRLPQRRARVTRPAWGMNASRRQPLK